MKVIVSLLLYVIAAAQFSAPAGMTLVSGGVSHMGIDRDDVPRFQDVFQIKSPRLFEDEIPKHEVDLDNFYIDQELVTNARFRQFLESNPKWSKASTPEALQNGTYLRDWTGNTFPIGKDDHPVVNISWYAAVAYCQSQGKRLPTEAEWEFAARGGSQHPLFPWGDETPNVSRANYASTGLKTTTPVHAHPANGLGLFDMAGNAWQFTADEWKPYPSGTVRNPVAGGNLFESGDAYLKITARRTIRGGSWGAGTVNMWVEYRDSHPPDDPRDFVGFRCARSIS